MGASSTVADAQKDNDTLTAADLMAANEQGVQDLRVAVASMSVEQLCSRPVAGKWSTLEVICHIADSEQVFADRMKRTLALDRPLLLGVDGFHYLEPLHYQELDVNEELDLVAVARRQMARTLQVTDRDFDLANGNAEGGAAKSAALALQPAHVEDCQPSLKSRKPPEFQEVVQLLTPVVNSLQSALVPRVGLEPTTR